MDRFVAGPRFVAFFDRLGPFGAVLKSYLDDFTGEIPMAAAANLNVTNASHPILRAGLPMGLRNGGQGHVELLFLKGHLGDPAASSPALVQLEKCLDSTSCCGIALTNTMGSGKTKTALDLLRVCVCV